MAIPGVRPRFLAPGDKLGKFELIRQIAVGGMAELYLARTMGIEGFEKLVVVKRILPQYADNQQFVSMFLSEARLSATLHHPNIAQVYDIGVEDGDYFFSMEYIHGEDLGRLHASAIENGVPLSLDAALTLIAGLCAGLHYAHTKAGPDGRPLAVVHRDVSPSNVLVSYDGGVKLVDFGIARAGGSPATTRGGLKGKIAYMSPEQCRGDATLDRRSDIFSVGTLLFELTCGRLPFLDENEYAVLNNIVNVDVPRPSSIVPSYAPALEAIVLKALSRDPAKRHESALELQKELEDFAHDNRLRVSPLVLARVMGTLFPTRLEEWDQARAQGAFFVEQHVVRTLVESGRTQVEERLAQIPAPPVVAPALSVVRPPPDDEATDIVSALPPPRLEATDLVAALPPPPRASVREVGHAIEPFAPEDSGGDDGPFAADSRTLPGQGPRVLPRTPTPAPSVGRASSPAVSRASSPSVGGVHARGSAPSVARASSPVVARASSPAVPVHGGAAALAPEPFAAPGTLVSNPAGDAAFDDHEHSARVRSPRNDDTAFVRTDRRSRAPLVIALALVLAGAGVAAFIAIGGTDATSPAAATTEPSRPTHEPVIQPEHATPPAHVVAPTEPPPTEPTPTEPTPTQPSPSQPAVAAPDAGGEQATPDAALLDPDETPGARATENPDAPAAPKRPAKKSVKVPAKKPVKAVKKPAVKKAEPKAEPKKETEWNADSPFMPVRQ